MILRICIIFTFITKGLNTGESEQEHFLSTLQDFLNQYTVHDDWDLHDQTINPNVGFNMRNNYKYYKRLNTQINRLEKASDKSTNQNATKSQRLKTTISYRIPIELKKNSSSPHNIDYDNTRKYANAMSDWLYYSGKIISKCYFCGFDETDVPRKTDCYAAFESEDWTKRWLIKWFKAECRKTSLMFTMELTYKRKDRFVYVGDTHWFQNWERVPGTKLQILSRFWVKGCFKRFLDVGRIYTQRGCRRKYPVKSLDSDSKIRKSKVTFATSRYIALEKSLHRIKNGCRASPAASLTPFARSVSLWAFYHVCVCDGKYCNSGQRTYRFPVLLYLSVLFLVLE